MLQIVYPEHQYRLKKEGDIEMIFDELRCKWLRLTPEEWVRQHFLQYLIRTLKYPAALIAVEKEIKLGELKKRFDILVYNRQHQPWMMVECKATSVALSHRVLDQVIRYNLSTPVEYLVITNGHYSAAFHRDGTGLKEINELPGLE